MKFTRLMLVTVASLLACGEKPSAPTFSQFVDRYLDDFARRHPSIAAGNGIHAHDDLLEDMSPTAIQAEIAALKADRATLAAFDEKTLTPDERVDRRILDGVIDGWLLEQETLQNWRRNPMLYASALADGVHNLMTMEYAPAPERMRKVISKLSHVPEFFAAARANISNPPKLLAERGLVMMRGASGMLASDLALAFESQKGTPLMDSLATAASTARTAVDAYCDWLERDIIPNATGDFTIGAGNIARRYRAEELIDTPLDQLVAIGERELGRMQEAFRTTAEKLAPGKDPLATWQSVRRDHPKRGEVVAATQSIVDSLTAFVAAQGIATVPAGERVIVAPAPVFDLGFASMHASPPLEPTPVKSVYYITDANSGMSAEQQAAWLERYNYASLVNTSAHEAMPGHWLHSTYMRRTPGKVRRIWIGLNPFPQPSSGQDGWAHYAEQMILDEHYGNDNPRFRLAQLSDALTRICRLLSGIRIHTKVWTLEQAQACFEQQAYVPAAAARREAERASYDPTYGGYFLGKMALLKLRDDYAEQRGSAFALREFHERIMSNGIAPVWAHRQLLLPGDAKPLLK